MANSTITNLGVSSAPLAGTEVIPVVQSGTTKQVSVANLTAGRDVSMKDLTTTGNTTLGDASTDTVKVNGYMGLAGAAPNAAQGIRLTPTALTGTSQYGIATIITGTSEATTAVYAGWFRPVTAAGVFTCTNAMSVLASAGTAGAGSTITNLHGVYIENLVGGTNNYGITSLVSSGANKWNFYAAGTADNYAAGNWKFAAAKGINFTANTPAAGMTSQLLNWYEEGTWTPTLVPSTSGTITLNTSFDTAAYTRVGRQVTCTGFITVASVSLPVGTTVNMLLPFTPAALPERSAWGYIAVGIGASGAEALALALIASGVATLNVTTTAASVAAGHRLGFSFSYFA